jgi:hypothetical protein
MTSTDGRRSSIGPSLIPLGRDLLAVNSSRAADSSVGGPLEDTRTLRNRPARSPDIRAAQVQLSSERTRETTPTRVIKRSFSARADEGDTPHGRASGAMSCDSGTCIRPRVAPGVTNTRAGGRELRRD